MSVKDKKKESKEKEESHRVKSATTDSSTPNPPRGMDRQYTLCVLVPAHQYCSYVDNYHHLHHHYHHQRQQAHEQQCKSLQRPTYQYQQQQQQQQHQEQIYENVVSQYRMRMCYHNDYENDEQIQRFYWEQCYRRDDADATAYYYCEYVRMLVTRIVR